MADRQGRSRLLWLLRRLWTTLFVLVALVFIVRYLRAHWDQLRIAREAALVPLLVTTLLQFCFWLASAMFWRTIVRVVSGGSLTLKEGWFHIVLVAMGKYIPGKVWGMLARGTDMARRGIGAEAATRATVYEQLILLHSSVLLCAVLTAGLAGNGWAWGLAIAAMLLLPLSGPLQSWAYTGIRVLAERLRKDGFAFEPKMVPARTYAALVAAYCLIWMLNGLVLAGLYYTFFGNGFDLNVLATLVLATVVGVTVGFFAFFAPGGIGVREAAISAVLVSVMRADQAVMISLLFRVWLVALDGLLGIVLLWGRPGVRRHAGHDHQR